MKRVHTETRKHGNEIRELAANASEREVRERVKAARKEAKEASLEYQTGLEQRRCIQNLYHLEKEWKKASLAKAPDLEKIENARLEILRALDKAAADSMGRIMAEIKQVYLSSGKLIAADLDVDSFYADFKRFVKKNFENYSVTEEEMNKILKPYYEQNLSRIQQLGKSFYYDKPAQKLQENIDYIRKIAVKENTLEQ